MAMHWTRAMAVTIGMTGVLTAIGGAPPAGIPEVIPLWPDAPASTQPTEKLQERGAAEHANRFVAGIKDASLTIYLPDPRIATGTAVIICPGGGYSGLAIDHEGHDIARWLNAKGVAGIVLKYRLPRFDETQLAEPLPVRDVHEALRLTREKAKSGAWPIDPHRIGIIGFSAGGHLAATAATHFDDNNRPDFAILGYPVITMHEGTSHGGSRHNLLGPTPDPKMEALYSNEEQVTAQTPPTFLFHAKDDRTVPIWNSEHFAAACRSAGVPVEIHEYEKGGHGFGLGHGESAQWPDQCIAWMKTLNLLPPPAKP